MGIGCNLIRSAASNKEVVKGQYMLKIKLGIVAAQQVVGLFLSVIAAYAGTTLGADEVGLEAYASKDLRKLDENALKEYGRKIESLTGDKVNYTEWRTPRPWWLKPVESENAAWILLEAYPGYDVPDMSFMCIQVFDKKWKRCVRQTISTGYRMKLDSVEGAMDNSLKQFVLVAKVSSTGPFVVLPDGKRPAFEQGAFQRQYYAMLEDRVVLVRLDDDTGQLAQNHYRWRSPSKGPPVPKRTREEWIRSLESESPVRQLETLVWLTGTHLPSTQERSEHANQESVEDSTVFEAVRDAQETSKALRSLKDSKVEWVSEYATLALDIRKSKP